MPRLPRNLHLVATWHSPDNAIRKKNHATRHVSSAAPATQNDDGHVVLPLPRKLQHIFWKRRKSIAPATQNHFRHVTKHVWMSRHACHAKRSNATFETSKNDTFRRTYHRHGHMAITRTVANGCGRLRTVADGWTSCERLSNVERTHPQPSDPQSETGTLATHSGIMGKLWKNDVREEERIILGYWRTNKRTSNFQNHPSGRDNYALFVIPYFMVQKHITPEGVISFLIVYCCGSHIRAAFINIVEGKLTLINFWSRNWMHGLRRNTGGLELWSE